jgi:hypothetical protein
MLITVFHGADIDDAKHRGVMHFDVLPSRGEEVEIDHRVYVVGRVWHLPSRLFAGAKLAILINETTDHAAVPHIPALASV